MSGKFLGVILLVWAPGDDFGFLGSSLGVILVVWELPDSYFTYLRSSWESCWLSEKLLGIVLATKVLGVILADWKAHVFGKLLRGF